jgi:hypothetical protein
MGEMLDEIAREMPEAFYRELNGGVQLSVEEKLHPESYVQQNLYILGEYHNDRKGYGGMGRYIVIYYGSFMRLYPYADENYIQNELRRVVRHEFTHHIESLAGERGLEIKDAIALERYKHRKFLIYKKQ